MPGATARSCDAQWRNIASLKLSCAIPERVRCMPKSLQVVHRVGKRDCLRRFDLPDASIGKPRDGVELARSVPEEGDNART